MSQARKQVGIPAIKTYLFRHPLYYDSKPTKIVAHSMDQAVVGAIEVIEDHLGHVMPRGMRFFIVYEKSR